LRDVTSAQMHEIAAVMKDASFTAQLDAADRPSRLKRGSA
jgi:hypothetical protein